MIWARRIPVALTLLRATLVPVLIWLALANPSRLAFGLCLVAALMSDILDGIVARRLRVAEDALRRLDSSADTVFYMGAAFAAWWVHPSAITSHIPALAVLVLLEISRYAVDLRKFGREASYHAWSSKVWGIALFCGFFALLALNRGSFAIALAIYVGIAADIEGLAISFMLPEWRADVPTFFHAYRLASSRAG